MNMLVAGALGGNGGFPGIFVAPRRLIVVAHEQPGRGRESEQFAHRTEELVRVAAGEICARGPVIGHEQRVADEHRIADLVADVGGGVAGRVQHFDLHFADLQNMSISEQPVEVGALGLDVGRVEQWAKNGLHILDMFADPDLRAGSRLDQRSTAEVIGVNMSLEHPFDNYSFALDGGEHFLDRFGVDLARGRVEVEHRVDHHAATRRRVPHQIGHGVGRLVEKCSNVRLAHRDLPGLDLYISTL